jgi:hypothetical protein
MASGGQANSAAVPQKSGGALRWVLACGVLAAVGLALVCCGGVGVGWWIFYGANPTYGERKAVRDSLEMNVIMNMGAQGSIVYDFWDAATLDDNAGKKVRVVRVKYHMSKDSTSHDELYLVRDDGVTMKQNTFGDDWKTKAAGRNWSTNWDAAK